jgi:hypothetical protein
MGAYVRAELDTLAEQAERLQLAWTVIPEYLERVLSLCSDRGRQISAARLRAVAEFARGRLPLLEAQARRALGMALRDAEELTAALALFERCGAVPYAARVRVERGLLRNDHAAMEAGKQVLRQLGDTDYLERIPQRA